jgi:hypothetical protein
MKKYIGLLLLSISASANATLVMDLGTSGVQNNGTLLGNTSISLDAAMGMGALRTAPADGNPESTRLSVGGDLTDLDMTGGYTFMAWTKLLAEGAGSIIGLGGCCDTREGYTLNYQGNGELRFWGGSSDDDSNYNLYTSSGALAFDGQYHHTAVRVGDNSTEIFVDGVLVASNGISNINTSPSLANQNNINSPGVPSIGGAKVDNGNTVDMLIDEVRVYGSFLSDDDIVAIAGGQDGPAADRLYFDFEDADQIPEPATILLFGLTLLGFRFGRKQSV